MADSYAVAIEGLAVLDDLDALPSKIQRIARMAVNATAARSRTSGARSMEAQVNFPRGYLTGANGRLTIAKYASENDLTALVRGRDRPTSLARFVTGGAKPGAKKGLSVEVKPGLARRLPGAFAIKLKNNNIGLAVRTKDGRPPSMGAKLIGKNLYLLYGPTVDQVFDKTREMIRPEMEEFMTREFNRLMELEL